MIRKTSLLFLLLLSLNNNAVIFESDEIQKICEYVNGQEETMVVFDIDNTIACPITEIGSDQWFNYLLSEKQKEIADFNAALKEVLPTYWEVQKKTTMMPVESTTPKVIETLQATGKIKVIALTARSFPLIDSTLQQLADINVDFSKDGLFDADRDFSTKLPSKYRRGIVFCQNNCKGEVLLNLLQEAHWKPKKVIFADDKRKYLEAVEKVLAEKGIEFVGIRYGKCDERVRNFNAIKAEQELQEFLQKHPQFQSFD